MFALHRTSGPQITAALLANAHRMTEDSERSIDEPEGECGRHSGKTAHRNPETVVIWSFVAFSVSASFL